MCVWCQLSNPMSWKHLLIVQKKLDYSRLNTGIWAPHWSIKFLPSEWQCTAMAEIVGQRAARRKFSFLNRYGFIRYCNHFEITVRSVCAFQYLMWFHVHKGSMHLLSFKNSSLQTPCYLTCVLNFTFRSYRFWLSSRHMMWASSLIISRISGSQDLVLKSLIFDGDYCLIINESNFHRTS